MYNLIQKLFEPKSNCSEAAKLFVDLLHVNITRTTLTQNIEEHPDYPGLLSISDVLNSYGVANLSALFERDQFLQVPAPFITRISGKNRPVNYFAVVSAISKENVRFYDHENAKWDSCPADEFYKRSSGIVLMAEVEDNAGEKEYTAKAKSETRKLASTIALSVCIPLLLIFSGIAGLIQHGFDAVLPFAFSLGTLAGAIVGILLILYELDQYTPVLQKLCRQTHKINCSAVLTSKGARVAGISWATIGFTYFTGQVLLMLFQGVLNPGTLFMVSWLNAFAAPYILFSLFYQWRVIKQWCVLCLSVQLILLLQLVIALVGQWHTALPFEEVFTAPILVPVALANLVPFLSVTLLVPAYQAAKRGKNNHLQLQRLKHNRQIFESLLTKQKKIVNSPEGMGIQLGNPNGTTSIVKVCNPYCGPCSESHKTIHELLDNNPDLQVQIIFLTSEKEEDIRKTMAMHLMAIAEKGEETTIKEALDNWYLSKYKDYDRFATMYPVNGGLKKQTSKVEGMHNWCTETKIDFTPTFFVNGYQLPEIYTVTDLKYFLSV